MISLLLKLETTCCNYTNQIKIEINHNIIKIFAKWKHLISLYHINIIIESMQNMFNII